MSQACKDLRKTCEAEGATNGKAQRPERACVIIVGEWESHDELGRGIRDFLHGSQGKPNLLVYPFTMWPPLPVS